MPLDPDACEALKIVVPDGLWTPIYVPRGAINATSHYQGNSHLYFAWFKVTNLGGSCTRLCGQAGGLASDPE